MLNTQKRQFGIAHLDEKMQENLLSTHIYSSISTLIEMKDKVSLGKPIPLNSMECYRQALMHI